MLDMVRLKAITPGAKAQYLSALAAIDGAGLSQLQTEHFLAQCLHETGGLTVLEECMNYRSADRLMEVWPRRFPTAGSAEPYVREPEKLANFVYGSRMGNSEAGDGWKFRGRGLLQLTGRYSYERYGTQLGAPLLDQPELAYSAELALAVALAEFDGCGAAAAAEDDDLEEVTRVINGGLIGLRERAKWLQLVRNNNLLKGK